MKIIEESVGIRRLHWPVVREWTSCYVLQIWLRTGGLRRRKLLDGKKALKCGQKRLNEVTARRFFFIFSTEVYFIQDKFVGLNADLQLVREGALAIVVFLAMSEKCRIDAG